MSEEDGEADLDYHEVMAEYTLLRLEVVCLKSALDLARSEIAMLKSTAVTTTLDIPPQNKKKKKELSLMTKEKLEYYHKTKDAVAKELGLAHPPAWQSIKKMTDEMFLQAKERPT